MNVNLTFFDLNFFVTFLAIFVRLSEAFFVTFFVVAFGLAVVGFGVVVSSGVDVSGVDFRYVCSL